jgi:hypothetical protein
MDPKTGYKEDQPEEEKESPLLGFSNDEAMAPGVG